MTFKTHRIIPILLALVFVCVTSCERTIIKVEETETEKMTEVSETKETETEGVTVVPETEEMTEEPETTAFDDPYDITAEELYCAIRNDEIPYDDAVKYPAFRTEVEQMFSEVLGHPIAWEDFTIAIGDRTDMYHYSFWLRDSAEYILLMECMVDSWLKSDGSIGYSLTWSNPYCIYGTYSFGDVVSRCVYDSYHLYNGTLLRELLSQSFDLSAYTIQYEGIRWKEQGFYVPMRHDGGMVCAVISLDADLQYHLQETEIYDLMTLSPYEFLVVHQAFGLKPLELGEYCPSHPLNPLPMLSEYFGIADILQSDYYLNSGFGAANYLRVQNIDTEVKFDVIFDVIFDLCHTETGEMVQIDMLSEETTYQDLTWMISLEG